MTWKWLMMIILSVLAASWILYGILHAINGIAYEFEILMNAMRNR